MRVCVCVMMVEFNINLYHRRARGKRPSFPPKAGIHPIRTRGPLANGRAVKDAARVCVCSRASYRAAIDSHRRTASRLARRASPRRDACTQVVEGQFVGLQDNMKIVARMLRELGDITVRECLSEFGARGGARGAAKTWAIWREYSRRGGFRAHVLVCAKPTTKLVGFSRCFLVRHASTSRGGLPSNARLFGLSLDSDHPPPRAHGAPLLSLSCPRSARIFAVSLSIR